MRLRCAVAGGRSFAIDVPGPRTTIADLTVAICEHEGLSLESTTLFSNGVELDDPAATLLSLAITPEHGFVVATNSAPRVEATDSMDGQHGGHTEHVDPASVQKLCDMGFPVESTRAALRAASGEVHRAAELLLSGAPLDGNEADAGPLLGTNDGKHNKLAWLRFSPQFARLAREYDAEPHCLGALVESISESEPEILGHMNANPAALIELLNGPAAFGSVPVHAADEALQSAVASRVRMQLGNATSPIVLDGVGSEPTVARAHSAGEDASNRVGSSAARAISLVSDGGDCC